MATTETLIVDFAPIPTPADRLGTAIEELFADRRPLRALAAWSRVRDAAGELVLEMVEDSPMTEEEVVDELAELLDSLLTFDKGVEAYSPDEPRVAPILRWVERGDRAFWAGRLRRWLKKAKERQADEDAARASTAA